MAAHLTKNEIETLPVQSYSEMRRDLQTGDLVFCSGSYFFSQTIQKATGSVWSHIGMIYRGPTVERVFIFESETLIGAPGSSVQISARLSREEST